MAEEVKAAGFKHALLLGKADQACVRKSCADLRQDPGYPELHVLDSTDPAQFELSKNALIWKHIFVCEQIGRNTRANIFKQYFLSARSRQAAVS